MNALVGNTGFVGSNLCASAHFDAVYHSSNIETAYGTAPDFLIYAGLRAEKYLANQDPEKDLGLIRQAEINIEKIRPKKLVLISTVDVFKEPRKVDENTEVDTEGLPPYGYNRYVLECWVRSNYPDALIVRLPGLFGIHLKKNFIYDYMNVIPAMLRADKFNELVCQDPSLRLYYRLQNNGFYKAEVPEDEKPLLKEKFHALHFSALNFTDSRSLYQFYPLARLWDDIGTVLKEGIGLWHPATEPVSAGELYRFLSGSDFHNELNGTPAYYDYRTVYDSLFAGRNGYIMEKDEVLKDIKRFVK